MPSSHELFHAIKNNYLKSIENSINEENCQIIVDDAILADCLAMWEKEIKTAIEIHAVDPSDYKVAGYLAFWIRKLKPFSLSAYDVNIEKRYQLNMYINELVGIQLGLFILYIDNERSTKNLSASLLNRTLRIMRYRSLSPHTMALIYEFFFET